MARIQVIFMIQGQWCTLVISQHVTAYRNPNHKDTLTHTGEQVTVELQWVNSSREWSGNQSPIDLPFPYSYLISR